MVRNYRFIQEKGVKKFKIKLYGNRRDLIFLFLYLYLGYKLG